jgi:hypothetical protein
MRLAATAVLATIVLALSACAAPPPPWKEYVYPAWGFAASFRTPPKETDNAASADGSRLRSMLLETTVDGHDYVVAVSDASAATKSDDDILRQLPQALAQGGKVSTPTYAATGSVIGREVIVNPPGQRAHRVRMFMANKRLYQVAGSSVRGTSDPDITHFLDSFRLLAP